MHCPYRYGQPINDCPRPRLAGVRAKAARAFPEVTESTVRCRQNNTWYVATAHPTGGHVHSERASPPWTTCFLIGAVVHQQVHTYLTKLLEGEGVVNTAIALAAARGIQKATRSGKLRKLGRGRSKSFMERMGFVMRKAIRLRRANTARQRLDRDN